jgi:hypothetical protein
MNKKAPVSYYYHEPSIPAACGCEVRERAEDYRVVPCARHRSMPSTARLIADALGGTERER